MGTFIKIGFGVGVGFVLGWAACQKNTIQLLSSEMYKHIFKEVYNVQ